MVRDSFCSYYTNSKDITSYMAAKLGIDHNDLILEPSAGEGIFIDEILSMNKAVRVDALDANSEAIAVLKKKYKNNDFVVVRETDTLLDEQLDSYSISQLWLKQTDTLLDYQLDVFGAAGGHYSKVIGNPPYGAWQDFKKRDVLKKKFAGHYVKETYALFLLRCISVLKMHGKLTFIVPDTFLFLNMHARLREVLFSNTKIDEILIFSSKFFPGVSFGYSNLSIITLERCERNEALENKFKVIRGFKSSNEFKAILGNDNKYPDHLQIYSLVQKDVLANEQSRMILAEPKTSVIIKKTPHKLGDIANIVTGFYTGDNQKFIKVLSKSVKGAKNYEVIKTDQIFRCTSLYGIPDVQEGYVPYIKSTSKRRYLRQNDEWFVRWDRDTIDFYNKNKKSRFQNSSFYFKTGIGIPMVKSNTIRAFLMQDHVFDQSIVGIFPKQKDTLYYLLAFMNSDLVNTLIHTINPTANNSANYIKQIPYIEPAEDVKGLVTAKVKKIILLESDMKYAAADELHGQINGHIEDLYS